MANAWANAKTKKESQADKPPMRDMKAHYEGLFAQKRSRTQTVRMALVGKENTAKTGTAVSLARQHIGAEKQIIIFDVDNSAVQTIAANYPDDENILVIPLYDELDDTIFNDDNSTNYTALVDKMGHFINIVAQKCRDGEVGAVIMDGMSSFLKWCEFAMTDVLMNRSKNPVNVEDGDKFNQAEWRIRNKLFRDIANRAHQLPVDAVFFTFHLKNKMQFADVGNGQKGLMKIGEEPEWEKGTMRLFSQQLWMTRYTKKGDLAAGVKADKNLDASAWEIRASIEEMKGFNQEHLGSTHTVLSVKNGEVVWTGLPFLAWG
tara:strand:+ start:2722 stop:3675 length:954 start_codon:yes stop_codon:yes gene_type:complete